MRILNQYITKNGKGDLAILSIKSNEHLVGSFELKKLLNEGLKDVESKKVKPATDIFKSIREGLINEKL